MTSATDFASIQNTVFNYAMIITYILYFLIAIGLNTTAPQYLSTLQFFIKLYISGFLIYRFNFFRKITKFTDFDRKVSLSAGMFLLTTTLVDHFIYQPKSNATNTPTPVTPTPVTPTPVTPDPTNNPNTQAQ